MAHRLNARTLGLPLLGLFVALVAACGGVRSPCAVGRCPDGTVCDLDGACRALPDPAQATIFSEADVLFPLAWTNPNRVQRQAPTDRLRLGGRDHARVNMVFAVPTYRRAVVEAVLVLFPYANGRTATHAGTLAVTRVRASEVLDPRHRSPLLRIGRRLAARVEQPSATQAVRLDVSAAVRAAAAGRLGVQVRMTRGGDPSPWLFASPESLDEARRPRLELLLR